MKKKSSKIDYPFMCFGSIKEAKSLLIISRKLIFPIANPMPSKEIQKAQKEVFGFEWEKPEKVIG